MEKREFGKTKNGQEVCLYTMKNKNQMEVSIASLGATIVSVKVPDKNGTLRDVVLGYDNALDYQNHTYYFGAVIGRYANRISDASCEIDGVTYSLEVNDNENNLHSGSNGLHDKVWEFQEAGAQKMEFSCVSADKEQGFPGTMKVKVTYELTDENELSITYEAVSDKTTVANFTNHSYFNLDGHESGNVEKQELEILASYYTPVSSPKAIPTGEIKKVTDTPMDFRRMKKIGEEIEADFEQLHFGMGYDHNFVLDKADAVLQLAARAKAAESGICMDVYTDCIGMQLYSGNFVEHHSGKGGAVYGKRQGFCLETQYFPNAINEKNFVSPILKAGDTYKSTTKYCFSVEK